MDHRRHAGTVRDVEGNGEAVRPGGVRRIRLLPSYSRGLKLYLVCAGDGMPVMRCLAHPKIGEREVVTALLERE